jgi:hypothetical protein
MQPIEPVISAIAKTIRAGKWAIMVGPDLLAHDGKAFSEHLLAHMGMTGTTDAARYFQQYDLFTFENNLSKMTTYTALKDFYAKTAAEVGGTLYSPLCRLPVSLVVSLLPDAALRDAFRDSGQDYAFKFYHRNEPSEDIAEQPTAERPLVYNLFGHIDAMTSLVLTHEDLLNYLFAMLGERKLPQGIRTAFDQVENILFLGCKLDRWHMQILLRHLNLHEKDRQRLAPHNTYSDDVVMLYQKHFKLDFLSIDPRTFLTKLYEACEREGVLRQGAAQEATAASPRDQIRQLIVNNHIEQAANRMVELVQPTNDDLADDLTLVLSSFKLVEKQSKKGIITESDYLLQTNKIKDSLLEYLKEIPA